MRKQDLFSGVTSLLALEVAIPSAQGQNFRVLHEFEDGQRDGASPGLTAILINSATHASNRSQHSRKAHRPAASGEVR